MSESTGPILAAGALTLFTDVVISRKPIMQDTRVIVGTAVAALGLGLVERVNVGLAVGLAWTALITTLFVRVDKNTPAPIEAFQTWYRS